MGSGRFGTNSRATELAVEQLDARGHFVFLGNE
jgi:hypothetical protein